MAVCVFFCLIFAITDLAMPQIAQCSDYICSFYVSSKLIATGRIAEVYPLAADKTLAETAYNKAAHQILPRLPDNIGALYFYPPIVAGLLIPFSLLPPSFALLAFQIASLLALAKSAGYICSSNLLARQGFLQAFLFSPAIIVVWIGQLDILLGVLPYALMYFFLARSQPTRAGFAGSLAIFKAQLAIGPFLVALLFLSRKQWRVLGGFCAGGIIIVALDLLLFGLEPSKGWLAVLHLMDTDFGSRSSGAASHLAASIPHFIRFFAPHSMISSARLLSYGFSAATFLLTLIAAAKIVSTERNDAAAAAIGLTTACFLLPVCAPYLFLYSLSVFVVAGMLIFGGSTDACAEEWRAFIRPRAMILWVVLSVYPFFLVFARSEFMPLFILFPIFIVLAEIIRFGLSKKNKPS